MRMCLIIRFDGYRNAYLYFSSFHLHSSLYTYGATIQREPMQRIMMELK